MRLNNDGERYRQMAKLLGNDLEDKPRLANQISAPYEVPQYPIEQIEAKLNRYVIFSVNFILYQY